MSFDVEVIKKCVDLFGMKALAEEVILYHDEVYYTKMIDDLCAKKKQLAAHKDKIVSLTAQLDQHWTTPAAAMHKKNLKKTAQQIDDISDRIDKAKVYLDGVVKALYKEEQKAQKSAEESHAMLTTFIP